jgi:hypothetical protein
VLGRRFKGQPNHWVTNNVSKHVAQRNNAHELALRWASPAFHHNQPVHSPLPEKREKLTERVILRTGDHTRKIERALGERRLDFVVEACVGA